MPLQSRIKQPTGISDSGFMSLYGYNFILLLPIACMFAVLIMTKRIAKNQQKNESAENVD